ncbi:MAG TPA: DNA replication and repair protein RecF [Spirochaetota bacterium]|nr:DNA replication and repair protein RecF [Spirochaetota bacterium]
MILTNLRLNNFRNYESREVEFSPDINLIYGNNGSGKTNILEAISVISNLKSFRNANDQSMIRWNSEYYYCRGDVSGSDFSRFEVGFYKDDEQSRKKIKIDDYEIKRVSEYYGKMMTVSFVPSDINILGTTPDVRRKYFDSVISKLFPDYINDLNRFRDILNSRNVVLKKIKEGSSNIKHLDVWNRLIAEKALCIIKKRDDFINIFSKIFNKSYSIISGESHPPFLFYKPSIKADEIDEIYNTFLSDIKSDIRRGSTTQGPQRDDYYFINSEGINFLSYSSQGQRRTAAISLKVAEYEIIKSMRNKKSIILIDDIFSELDEIRRFNMIDLLMSEGQLIFTMVNRENFPLDKIGNIKYFKIDNGELI